ncbi:MAG: hypothetical protein HY860_02105 [Chlamydiales bacterium]|nr:hypothetical protein [Chlamydiales bacterium]
MNEYILENKKRRSFWTTLVDTVFSAKEALFPFWLLIGPVFTILSGSFFLSFFSDIAIVMGFILSLGLVVTYRLRLLGFVFSTLLLIYPIFVKVSCSSSLKICFFLSFVLSFIVFLLSVEEFYSDKETFLKNFNKAKEEGALWNKRFETLSDKYEEMKVQLQEEEDNLTLQLSTWDLERKSLEELIRVSSLDAIAMQKENSQLSISITSLRQEKDQLQKTIDKTSVAEEEWIKCLDEIDALKQGMAHLQEIKETTVVADEEWDKLQGELEGIRAKNQQLELLQEVSKQSQKDLLDEINALRVKCHQLELLQEDKTEQKKQDKKKMRISDDELLFSFYDVSHSAIENVVKYKKSQVFSY